MNVDTFLILYVVSEEELEDYAREYDMTLEEFKKYVDYFLSYNETRMF